MAALATKVIPVEKTYGVFQYKDKVLQFTVVDDEGAVVDITGWALEWGLWPVSYESGTAAVVTRTTGGGGIAITDGPSGELQVTLTKSNLSIDAGEYRHELRRTDSGYEDNLIAPSPFWLLASPSQ